MGSEVADPARVVAAWPLTVAGIEPVISGHINLTFKVSADGAEYCLQRLSPIFSPEVHLDIEAVTAALHAHGMTTPRLVRTRAGALWTCAADGAVWRLLTWIPGETLQRADSPERCAEAGRLLGRFHRALWDLPHAFAFTRLGVHDTRAHLDKLARALQEHPDHPAFAEVAPAGSAILAQAAGLELDRRLPAQAVHGDPKISNLVFDPQRRAVCLVDLDTLGRMPLAVELGDAFRSWCNLRGEEEQVPFETPFFEAGLHGWREGIGDLPGAAEVAAIPALTEQIALELAARFCADALNESYFGWDPARYPSRAAHNLARARSQLALARSIADQRPDLERVVRETFRLP